MANAGNRKFKGAFLPNQESSKEAVAGQIRQSRRPCRPLSPGWFQELRSIVACGVGKWAKGSGASGAESAGIGGKGVSEGPQAVCKNSPVRAGERGGAQVGNPRWARILAITAGSSMAAMMVKGPPQCGQDAMSIANTRLSNCAQLRRVRVEA